jgi:hypothetical protein
VNKKKTLKARLHIWVTMSKIVLLLLAMIKGDMTISIKSCTCGGGGHQ